MFKATTLAFVVAASVLPGLASPAALLCSSTLPAPVGCIGAGGSCGEEEIVRVAGPIVQIDVQRSQDALGILLACASDENDKCDDLGRWTVRAGFTEGDGTVTISAYCGGISVASCGTKIANTPCEDVGESGTGVFECNILVDGDIDTRDVSGECVDPIDPTRVVAATIFVADAILYKE